MSQCDYCTALFHTLVHWYMLFRISFVTCRYLITLVCYLHDSASLSLVSLHHTTDQSAPESGEEDKLAKLKHKPSSHFSYCQLMHVEMWLLCTPIIALPWSSHSIKGTAHPIYAAKRAEKYHLIQ